MRLRRHSLFAGLMALLAGCTSPDDRPPIWEGTFVYRAEGALVCTQTTASCDCEPIGHYEGTLTLTGTEVNPQGTLLVRECHSNWSPTCSAPVALSIVPFFESGPDGQFGFCAGMCSPGSAPNDGGWQHWVTPGRESLNGTYRRADGTSRGCGLDFSTFTAIRQ